MIMEQTKKLVVNVPVEKHYKMKRIALDTDTTMKELFMKFLDKLIEDYEEEKGIIQPQ